MKKILSALVCMAIGITATAQSTAGSLKGTVFDTQTGETLIGAQVILTLTSGDVKTITDERGKFNINPIEPGSYTVTIRYVGLEERQFQVTIDPNQATLLNNGELALGESKELGKGITVVAHKLIDPEETNLVRISAKEIKNSPNLRNMSSLISAMSADITQGSNGELYFRGARGDANVQFIDGIKQTGAIISVPGRAISSVSVYTGGIPAKYGDTVGGVIVVETKTYSQMLNERSLR